MKIKQPQNIPATLVIWFVGIALILSLIMPPLMLAIGKTGLEMRDITLMCITGLLALLARTSPQEPERQRATDFPTEPPKMDVKTMDVKADEVTVEGQG